MFSTPYISTKNWRNKMSIIFRQLLITDISQQVSKKVFFSPGINLITSESNSQGKSIIMKSLYHTLGANAEFDELFKQNSTLFDLTLEYKNKIYRVCRFKDSYRILKNGVLIKNVKKKNIYELSSFFKDELDAFVFLKNRAKTTELAPPAFLFIPYYLDQDLSWKREQFPFNNIGQYESLSRNELYYYHLNVYTENYNKNKSEQTALNKQIAEIQEKAMKDNVVFMELKRTLKNDAIAVDETEFNALMVSYSSEMNELLEKLDKQRKIISVLEKEKIDFLIEENRINATLEKLKEDRLSTTKMIECPVCKTEIEINLEKELGFIYDEKILNIRLDSIAKSIEELEERIISENKSVINIQEEINDYDKRTFENRKLMNEYLNRKVTETLLQQKSGEAAEFTYQINLMKEKLSYLRTEAKDFKTRSELVNADFIENYKTELYNLEAPEFNPNSIKPFYKLRISGSQYVRSTLAFYYSFIKTKEKHKVMNFLFPMVIDSPREGEQDDFNSKVILEYIFANKLNNYQLIVATVNAKNYVEVTDKMNLIELDGEKRRVMNKEEYIQNFEEINAAYILFKKTDL